MMYDGLTTFPTSTPRPSQLIKKAGIKLAEAVGRKDFSRSDDVVLRQGRKGRRGGKDAQ